MNKTESVPDPTKLTFQLETNTRKYQNSLELCRRKKTNENLDDVTKRIRLRQADIKIKVSKQISKMLETPTGLS